MPKLYSSDEIQKVLISLGFNYVSQKGSHGKFRNKSGSIVILPMNKKEIPFGTFRSILRQANIDKTIFNKILK
jgi:predicted RNA binding protein YcfA (HicA-like mRNA interferase family)